MSRIRSRVAPFCIAVAVWILDAVVDDPVLPHQRIRVREFTTPIPLISPHAPVVLAPRQFDPVREILVEDRFVVPLT